MTMFGSKHYVPILRSKMAERLALRNLLQSDRRRITPLIELTPASFKARKRGEIRETPDPVRVLDEETSHWQQEKFPVTDVFSHIEVADGRI
jgi:hypothetical protein